MADVWADRLREWFAFRVLQPLARVLERSHEDVARTLEALGETDFPRPRPLLSADDAHGDRERAGYNARGAETAGALEQDAMVLEQMRVRLEAALAHARAQPPRRPRSEAAAAACLAAAAAVCSAAAAVSAPPRSSSSSSSSVRRRSTKSARWRRLRTPS